MKEMPYHFIGMGGIGMSGLAHLLLRHGCQVSGSDLNRHSLIERLEREGAHFYQGHAANQVPKEATVIYSTDIHPNNIEYQSARVRQLPLLHRSQLLAKCMQGKRAIAVTGTHGKTTTSALLATLLLEAGHDPSFIVGGILSAIQCNARYGASEWFICEADESDGSFLNYSPEGAIVTNIDHDHLEHYGDEFERLCHAFDQFLKQVKYPEYLFWCRDDPTLTSLQPLGHSYGFHSASEWRISNVRQEGFRSYFDLHHQTTCYADIELALIGRHQVLNATAVFALGCTLGIAEEVIRRVYCTFQGVQRRCEQKGVCRDVLFLDDYAHHPTEIRTTLSAIREAIGDRRLIAVYQPHRYSRTVRCIGQYEKLFENVDKAIVTDIYAAGEEPIPNVSHELILREVAQQRGECRYCPRSLIQSYLVDLITPHDVVVTLGAGDLAQLSTHIIAQWNGCDSTRTAVS